MGPFLGSKIIHGETLINASVVPSAIFAEKAFCRFTHRRDDIYLTPTIRGHNARICVAFEPWCIEIAVLFALWAPDSSGAMKDAIIQERGSQWTGHCIDKFAESYGWRDDDGP